MGKRSTKSTKSGKFMNPTDQARKEARRKELKKNKKQRIAVRQAVLKGKDAQKIIHDLDEIDDMELNPSKPPSLGEKVLKDKRKKLVETLDRVMKLYEKEDPEYFVDVKELFTEYSERRQRKQIHYDEVKSAERVQIEEIPLPDVPLPQAVPPSGIPLPTADIPLPQQTQTKSILKRAAQQGKEGGEKRRKPPGPPPGPPPPLSDSEDEDVTKYASTEVDVEENTTSAANKQRTIRFQDEDSQDEEVTPEVPEESEVVKAHPIQPMKLTPLQAAMLEMAGQKVHATPTEEIHKQGEETYAEHGTRATIEAQTENRPMAFSQGMLPPAMMPGGVVFQGQGGAQVMRLPIGVMRLPGMPPGPPPGPPPGLPPAMRLHRLPTGMPPRLLRPPGILPPQLPPPGSVRMPPVQQQQQQSNVLSAPPSIQKPPSQQMQESQATISAKPQIKHHIGDVTRLVPTALRVKRDEQKKLPHRTGNQAAPGPVVKSTMAISGQTKDDAYDTFMKEMEGIM